MFKSDPSTSVGIITFNAKQQDKILDIIDRNIEEDKEFAVLYQQNMAKELDERLFVKILKTSKGTSGILLSFQSLMPKMRKEEYIIDLELLANKVEKIV